MNTRYGIYDQLNNGRQRRQSSMEDLEATIGGIEAKLDRMRGGQDSGYSAKDDMAERMRRISQEIEARQPAPSPRTTYAPVSRPAPELTRMSGDNSGAMAAMVAELQQIRSEMGRMANSQQSGDWNSAIRKEIEALKSGLGSLAREETLRSVESQWTKLAQRPVTGDPVIESMLERIEGIQNAVGNLPQTQTLLGVEEKIRVLANAVDQLSRRAPESNVNQLIQIEDRLDEISRAIVASSVSTPKGVDTAAFERLEARLASLNTRIDEIANSNHSADLNKRIGFLSSQVETIASRAGAPVEQMERMTSQMEVIAARINELDRTRPDPAAIASGLEDRLYEIASRLEKNHEETGREAREIFNELEQRLEDMAARLNSIDSAPQTVDNTDHILATVEQRFADLSRQLSQAQPEAAMDPVFVANIESRLESINNRLNESVASIPTQDSDALARLEQQVQNLALQLSTQQTDSDPFAALNPRLEAIENSLMMSQDAMISAARQAAEDVLRQAQFAGHSADSDMAIELANDLKALEALTRKSDERNTKTFEAIHDTLLKIVDRLNTVETAKPVVVMAQPQPEPIVPQPAASLPVASAPVDMKFEPAPKLDLGEDAPEFDIPDLSDRNTAASHAPSHIRSPAEAALAAARAVRETQGAAVKPEAAKAKGSFLSGLTSKLRRKPAAEPALSLPGTTLLKEEPLLDETLDSVAANSPIEPGSGTPDLGAIMKRVRDERKSRADGTPGQPNEDMAKNDFLAAARRAAQAAAADAEILRNKSAKAARTSEGGISALFQKQRKPIMMVAFAALLALTGLQLKKAFFSAPVETVAITEQVDQPKETATADTVAKADNAEAMSATEATGKEVRSVELQPSSQATAVETNPATPDVASTAETQTKPATSAEPEPVAQTSEPAAAATADVAATPKEELPPAEYGPVPLREAAASGDPKAQFEIATRLMEGASVSKDDKASAAWFAKAADQGFAPAQFRLGSLYEKGLGVERSAQKAKEYYQLAAEQGNASAMHNLAVLYATGAAGPVDNESAATWFVKAAELGVKDSQYNLGILAAKGLGVPQNLEESYKWFALAAKAGDKDAASKRDEIANALRPEQLEKARGATELWKAKPTNVEANSVDIPASWKTESSSTAATDPAQMTKAIRNIQAILNQQGFDAGAPDGKLGAKTKKAIADYQKANGMAATGEVDEKLINSLLEKVKKPKT